MYNVEIHGRSVSKSVVSQLLFIAFIDDLLGRFEERTLVSANADHLAVAKTREL